MLLKIPMIVSSVLLPQLEYRSVCLIGRSDMSEVPGELRSWIGCYSRHSGIMHFSTSSTSAPQMEPSAGGIFTMRSLLLMPRPQVALQTSHSPHSVTRQLLGAKAPKGEPGFSNPTEVVTFAHLCELKRGEKTHSIPHWPHSFQSPPWAACTLSHHLETASRNVP